MAEAAKLTTDAPLERLRHLDPFMVPTSGTVVHGDAHLNNVIWNGARVAALLDFEWHGSDHPILSSSRFSPPTATCSDP